MLCVESLIGTIFWRPLININWLENPRRLIQKYPEVKRERYLTPDEIKHLGDVLREVEQEGREMPSAILAIRLLIYTGCRLSEIMTLQWDYVDLEARTLNLPDSKSGAKKVFLGRPACELLGNAPRLPGNPWVITGSRSSRPGGCCCLPCMPSNPNGQ